MVLGRQWGGERRHSGGRGAVPLVQARYQPPEKSSFGAKRKIHLAHLAPTSIINLNFLYPFYACFGLDSVFSDCLQKLHNISTIGLISSKSSVGMARDDILPKGSMARRPLDWPTVVLRCERRMDTKALNLYCIHVIFGVTET